MNREGAVWRGGQCQRQRRDRYHHQQTKNQNDSRISIQISSTVQVEALFHARLHVRNVRAHKNIIFRTLHGPTQEAGIVVRRVLVGMSAAYGIQARSDLRPHGVISGFTRFRNKLHGFGPVSRLDRNQRPISGSGWSIE